MRITAAFHVMIHLMHLPAASPKYGSYHGTLIMKSMAYTSFPFITSTV